MSFMPHPRRTFIALGALGLALVLPSRASAQASAGVRFENSLSSCGNPSVGVPSGSPTSLSQVESYSHNGCNLYASGFSYLGVVGAFARADWRIGDPNAGGIRALGGGHWTETITPSIDSRYLNELGGRKLTFDYSVGAHGTTSASSTDQRSGGGTAGIGYSFSIAGQTYTGSEVSSTGAAKVITGEWGTITKHIDINAGNLFNHPFRFFSFGLTLAGYADASVGKISSPGLTSTADAYAEFGSTLLWMGISNVHLFDGSGTEIVMGPDANFGLIGETTGFDYQEAAVEVVTATPEPGSLLLVGTGVVLLGVARRRRVVA